MGEKVIHEVKIIETDDGFRVEVKGDKERMRKMFDHGMRFKHRHMHRHGPRRAWGWGMGYGPWGWWWDDEPEGEGEPAPDRPATGPAADV
jgi:hypothetical protein